MENQVMTEQSGKSPEQIEADMFATRESITDKVAALENHVVDTVQNATSALTDTVEALNSFVTKAPETVGEAVEQAATAVKERVQKTFDISRHVRENPWASVGMSIGLGCLVSYLLPRRERVTESPSPRPSPPAPREIPFASSRAEAPREPGLFDDLFTMLGSKVRNKVKELGETAIETAANALNKNIQDVLPKLVTEAAGKLMPGQKENTNEFDAAANIFGR